MAWTIERDGAVRHDGVEIRVALTRRRPMVLQWAVIAPYAWVKDRYYDRKHTLAEMTAIVDRAWPVPDWMRGVEPVDGGE